MTQISINTCNVACNESDSYNPSLLLETDPAAYTLCITLHELYSTHAMKLEAIKCTFVDLPLDDEPSIVLVEPTPKDTFFLFFSLLALLGLPGTACTVNNYMRDKS